MSLVEVHNEWDPLEEMIVGTATGARVPRAGIDLYAVEYMEHYDTWEDIPTGPYDARVVEEANEDLEGFVQVLQQAGVTVRRPAPVDHAAVVATPDWSTDGGFDYCPRDLLLTVGRTVIEAPMVLRSRTCEALAYRDLLLEYFASGANWVAAPRPRLLDETYDLDGPGGVVLRDLEPVFDAANVLRLGRDLLYLVSSSGNMLGCRWLQRVLGDGYRVHPVQGVYAGTHIDTTFTAVRPGLVVVNAQRVTPADLPAVIARWDVIWCDEVVDTGWVGDHPRASVWQAMNFVMLNPGLAVVNDAQKSLIAALEAHGVEVVPLPLRHARTLSGGFHCASLDIRRRGTLEDYS